MKQQLEALLEGRSERERVILIGGAVLAVVLIVWLAGIQPLLKAHAQAEARLEQRQQGYVWMQQAAAQIKAAGGSASSPALSGSPQQQITGAARQLDIKLSRIEPQNAGGYSVWIARSDYNNAVRFVDVLARTGLSIEAVNINLLDQPGTVSLRVVVGGVS